MLLILQFDWEHILEKWGWPVLVLVAVCLVVYKISKSLVWPFIIKPYLDRAEKNQEEVSNLLKERAQRLESAQDTLLTGIKSALDKSNDVQDTQIDLMKELLSTAKGNKDALDRLEGKNR